MCASSAGLKAAKVLIEVGLLTRHAPAGVELRAPADLGPTALVIDPASQK